ncbi:right-handed parallel beta-helix repeat-containing protein [Pontiella sulfatireligans]|nr:right-handed parallel beta-helix repeat-containing protein [Pontiella sulfatireligans]
MNLKPITILTSLLLAALLAPATDANTYTISPDGSDSNPGTTEKPFRTIAKAAALLNPGDSCFIQAGTYREEIVLRKSGTREAPVRVVGATHADGSPAVILDGTEPMDGEWKKEKINGVLAFSIPCEQPTTQLFYKGRMMAEARWPDQPFSRIWDRTTWADSEKGSKQDLMVCSALAKTGVDWTGAMATLNVGQQFQTWSRIVTSHEKGSTSFIYNLAIRTNNDLSEGPTWWDDSFYLRGKIEALTTPEEWFHNGERLYFIPPDGRTPKAGVVAIKTRTFGIEGKGVDHIEISGLRFFGCTFRFQNSDFLTIENCRILYPNYAPILTDTLPKGESAPIPQTMIRGNDNIVRKVGIAYGNTAGISLTGSRNRIENCVIHDFCWEGNLHHPAISIRSIGKSASDSTVSRCTIYNSGNMGIWHLNANNTIEYNEVYNTGLACKDIAAIQTGSPNTSGSVVHHNWAHDSRGKGIRGDDQTRGLTFHHNVIWNCDEGMILKGEDNLCYNNTIIGTNGHGCLIIPTRAEPRKWWAKTKFLDQQNTRSTFRNNLVETIAYRYDPLPQNKKIARNVETHAVAKLLRNPEKQDFRPLAKIDTGAYEFGKPMWTAGADWKNDPIGIDFVINATPARSWEIAGKSKKSSIQLPARIRNSNLSKLSKTKLQDLYDDCWTGAEVETRKKLIYQKNQLPDGSAKQKMLQKKVAALHRQVNDRLRERAGEVLAGSELTLFLEIK